MRALLAAVAVLLAATDAGAHAVKGAEIRISHPWVRPTPPGAVTAAAYLTVTNPTGVPDRLLAVISPAATRVAIHAMTMTGGVMRMREVAGGLVIPADGAVALVPGGGYHLMLVGVKRPLRIGMRVPATLTFAKAGDVAVVCIVQAAPTAANSMPSGMAMP